MSPKNSSLAYDEVMDETVGENCFEPEITLIVNKKFDDLESMEVSIKGKIVVSF